MADTSCAAGPTAGDVRHGDGGTVLEDRTTVVPGYVLLAAATCFGGATLTVESLPSGWTAETDGFDLALTPRQDDEGSFDIGFRLANAAAAVTATLTMVVTPVNDAPVAGLCDAVSVAEDAGPEVRSCGTVTPGGGADEVGQLVTATVDPLDADGAALFTTPPTVTIASDGAVAMSFESAPEAAGWVDVVVVVADDGGTADGGEDTVGPLVVRLTVEAVDDAPVARADAYVLDQDGRLDVPAPGVLGNDTDVDDVELTAAVVTPPLHGSLELASDGLLRYVPDKGFAGTDRFVYSTADSTRASSAEVVLTVTPSEPSPSPTPTPTSSPTPTPAPSPTPTPTSEPSPTPTPEPPPSPSPEPGADLAAVPVAHG